MAGVEKNYGSGDAYLSGSPYTVISLRMCAMSCADKEALMWCLFNLILSSGEALIYIFCVINMASADEPQNASLICIKIRIIRLLTSLHY